MVVVIVCCVMQLLCDREEEQKRAARLSSSSKNPAIVLPKFCAPFHFVDESLNNFPGGVNTPFRIPILHNRDFNRGVCVWCIYSCCSLLPLNQENPIISAQTEAKL